MSMKPDYYAVLGQNEYQKGFEGIDYKDVDAVTARYHMLVATGHKEDKDTGGNALRSQWAEKRLEVDLGQLPDFLTPSPIELSQLPLGSFYIQFEFKLLKPYISRDDNQFYIVDNPIVRDKVFRYPMVRSTAWKGSFRHALWQLGRQEEDEQIQRLFGMANDEKPDDGKRGRLYFYPTFFTQTSLEVINPHDRERRVGKNPILMESVPIGTKGRFTLLYIPLDRIGQNETETSRQIFADLQLVADGLQTMFTIYGFGAKTSSGFGLADNAVENGNLALKIPDVTFSQDAVLQVQAPDDEYLKYMNETGQVKPAFEGSGEGNLLSNREYKETGEQQGGGSLSEFKNFRRWYGEYGEIWQDQQQTAADEKTYSTINFEGLSQLVTSCQILDVKPVVATGGAA